MATRVITGIEIKCPICGTDDFTYMVYARVGHDEGYTEASEDEQPTDFMRCNKCRFLLVFL